MANDDDDACGCDFGECDDDCDFKPCHPPPAPPEDRFCHEHKDLATGSCDCICCGEKCGVNSVKAREPNFVCEKCVCQSACTPMCQEKKQISSAQIANPTDINNTPYTIMVSEVNIRSESRGKMQQLNEADANDDDGGSCDDCLCVGGECLSEIIKQPSILKKTKFDVDQGAVTQTPVTNIVDQATDPGVQEVPTPTKLVDAEASTIQTNMVSVAAQEVESAPIELVTAKVEFESAPVEDFTPETVKSPTVEFKEPMRLNEDIKPDTVKSSTVDFKEPVRPTEDLKPDTVKSSTVDFKEPVRPKEDLKPDTVKSSAVDFKEPIRSKDDVNPDAVKSSTASVKGIPHQSATKPARPASDKKLLICDGCRCVKGCNSLCEHHKRNYRGPVCDVCGCTDTETPCGAACLENMAVVERKKVENVPVVRPSSKKSRICNHCLCSQACNGVCEVTKKSGRRPATDD